MSYTEVQINSETSRIRAALVNSGQHSFAEAEEKLAGSRLSLVLGDNVAETSAGQAALLTAAVTGNHRPILELIPGPSSPIELSLKRKCLSFRIPGFVPCAKTWSSTKICTRPQPPSRSD